MTTLHELLRAKGPCLTWLDHNGTEQRIAMSDVQAHLRQVVNTNISLVERAEHLSRDYEQLRTLIDGGSESMTHNDAMAAVIDMTELIAEYDEAMRIAQAVAAMQIWTSIQSFFGVPIFAYKSDGTYTIWRHS